MFLNQLYKTPVELKLDRNPDLRAIRFASFNPILDPWIYILLRKAVFRKLMEKIKCLFCKMGAHAGQQRHVNFHCIEAHQLSSALSSRDSHSLVSSRELRTDTSGGGGDGDGSHRVFLYLPEGGEVCAGSSHLTEVSRSHSTSRDTSPRDSRGSFSSAGGSDSEVVHGGKEGADPVESLRAALIVLRSRPKDQSLQVLLDNATVDEKCI